MKCRCHEGWTGSHCETSLLQAAAPRLNASPQGNSSKTAKEEESGDALESPMTVSWLQPTQFAQSADELVKRSSRSTADAAGGLSQFVLPETAVSTAAEAAAGLSQLVLPEAAVSPADDHVLWHAAVAPPVAAARHGEASPILSLLSSKAEVSGKGPGAGEASSILSLLSSKAEVSGRGTGAERILEDIDQGLGHQSPFPNKLASLLALSPSVSAPVAGGDASGRSSDIDSVVGDI